MQNFYNIFLFKNKYINPALSRNHLIIIKIIMNFKKITFKFNPTIYKIMFWIQGDPLIVNLNPNLVGLSSSWCDPSSFNNADRELATHHRTFVPGENLM